MRNERGRRGKKTHHIVAAIEDIRRDSERCNLRKGESDRRCTAKRRKELTMASEPEPFPIDKTSFFQPASREVRIHQLLTTGVQNKLKNNLTREKLKTG
jgi:hypothetical protein